MIPKTSSAANNSTALLPAATGLLSFAGASKIDLAWRAWADSINGRRIWQNDYLDVGTNLFDLRMQNSATEETPRKHGSRNRS
jgi:hypothetical protein